ILGAGNLVVSNSLNFRFYIEGILERGYLILQMKGRKLLDNRMNPVTLLNQRNKLAFIFHQILLIEKGTATDSRVRSSTQY
ncbi:MAG: hypothetical protein ACRD8Z_21225, partial [Nitrososphaeraceae archaeon]